MPYDDEIFDGIGKPVAPPGSRTRGGMVMRIKPNGLGVALH